MRRLVLLSYMGLSLACLAGCHLLHHKKPVAADCCAPVTSCGCEGPIAGPIEPIPGLPPAGVVIPGPPKIIPGPPPLGIPGPPGH
jgi:hypothetical protein